MEDIDFLITKEGSLGHSSWAGSDTGRHRAAILERKVSWHVCVSGSSVGQSAGLVLCNCMVPGSALGGMLAFLLCAGLPSSCD